ncbi:hypothetical protein [Mycolicibacterium sp. A43C]
MTAPTIYAARSAVLRILARGEHSGAALRRAVKYEDRAGLPGALAELQSAGLVVGTPAHGGVRYALAEPVPATEDRRRNGGQRCERCEVRKRRATGRHCGTCLAELARKQVAS